MTSRDYIWTAAARDLKLADFEPLESSQVVVDVHELSGTDKQQILYNHLKFGDQPQTFKTAVKRHLGEAARSEPFLPEVARRFGSTRFTHDLGHDRGSVLSFFQHPVDHLRDVITKLDPDGRAALAFVYISGARLSRPVVLDAERERALTRLGSTLAGVTESLEALRGSLVSVAADQETGAEFWTFRHPTIGEAFRSIVEHDPQFFPLYLAGMSSFTLLEETTCGDRHIEGAVVIAEEEWPIVVRRLSSMTHGYELVQRDTYLARRVNCAFLRAYVGQTQVNKFDWSKVTPRLAARLKNCELLPEEVRQQLTDSLATSLVIDLDGEVLTPASSSLFTPDEYKAFIDRVRDELLPNLEAVLENLSSKYDESEDPAEWLADAYSALDALKGEFEERNDTASVAAVEDAIVQVGQLEQDLGESYVPEPDWDDYHDDFRGWSDPSGYDLFADVDA